MELTAAAGRIRGVGLITQGSSVLSNESMLEHWSA